MAEGYTSKELKDYVAYDVLARSKELELWKGIFKYFSFAQVDRKFSTP